MRHRLGFAFALISITWSSLASAQMATGEPATTFDLTTYVTGGGGVSLSELTDFRWVPDGRLVMTRKGGTVVVRKTDGSIASAGAFSVSTTSEQGLLGVEVHPSFATNKTLFFYYSAAGSIGGTDLDRQRIVSIVLKDDNTLDMATEKVLVKGLRGPANHDGGALALSKDGTKLFIGVGDTGCNSGAAPGGTITNYFGTCLTNGNGKVLRVNLDGSIPTDNPLVGVATASACGTGGGCGAASTDPTTTTPAAPRTDLWAWGFRNPWRLWTDPVTGNLWAGDVGEVTYEEITLVQKGRHHGWPYREGAHGYPVAKCKGITPDTGDCYDPLYDCQHGGGGGGEDGNCTSITGGQIVDSCDWPDTFRGKYYFGDNANGRIWSIDVNGTRDGLTAGSRKDFANIGGAVSIRTGPDRALYVAAFGGTLRRIAPKSPIVCPPPDAGPPDTGPADAGTDGGVDSGTTGDSTVDDTGTPAPGGTDDEGGCGCATPGHHDTATRSWILLILAGMAVSRLRRKS